MKKLLIFPLLLLTFSLFAIPGVRDPLPAVSGEYVYYRDYTFFSETYVGFLQYDDETIALRYFAHNPETGSSEVVTLISLDAEKDHIEIVGEKFITQVTQEDINIVNYLHDMLYEFAGRRKKLNGRDFSSSVKIEEDFFQFGGASTLVYEKSIPLFNLRRIEGEGGKLLLETITAGQLYDDSDNSFFDFKPHEQSQLEFKKEFIATGIKLDINPESKQVVKIDSQTVVLDDTWAKMMDNMWMLKNDAMLMLDTVEINPEIFTGGKFSILDYYARNFITSSKGVYILLPETTLQQAENALFANNTIFMEKDRIITRDMKKMICVSNNLYLFSVLSVYENAYQANKDYFDEIFASISAVNE